MRTDNEYVLGTGGDEHERLGVQHRLWANATHDAWMRAGLRRGETVLDLGCGPGWATFELAQWVGSAGRVLAADLSDAFVATVQTEANRRGLTNVDAFVADAVGDLDQKLADRPLIDLAWARWVFCFLPAPQRALEAIASRMRVGGRVVLHDYFNYTSMTATPRCAFHDRAVDATARSWRDAGGDPDVAAKLPALLVDSGFDVEHIAVHQRVARGADPMFAWPNTWWRTWAPKLVATGYLSAADCEGLLATLTDVESNPRRFVLPPPVTEIIARKR
jgi:SAM-dependent methyltransferase